MTLRNFIAAAAVALGVFAAGATVNVVPRPVSVEEHDGHFTLTSKTSIGYADGLKEYAMYLDSILLQSTGYELPVVAGTSKAAIALSIDSAAVGASEGYRLEVGRKRVTVVGADRGGLFYGLQTLLQLFPEQIHSDRPVRNVEWNAPCVSIFDSPERPWRGMMLDVARYFHDVDYVKHYIDMMA
ncbi:MAG: beta-N-acetylhexosaminidase, partial [Paramuribaculum sp.]|nr:beta-N-acetylhexosaminidase [Paramuribaculum sp.]